MTAPTKVAHTNPVGGTSSVAGLAYCAGPQLGDVFVLPVDYEGGSPGASSSPGSGWTLKGSLTGGGLNKDVWTKPATGGESGNVATINVTGATNTIASMELYRSTTGAITIGALVSGADASSDLAYSATTGSVTTDSNTLLVYMLGLTETSTRTARTLTQAGATLGTLTAYFGTGTGIMHEVGDRPVTVGATAGIANTYTLGTACTGLTGVLLLQETQVIAKTGSGSTSMTTSGLNAVLDITSAPTGDWVYALVALGTQETGITATGWSILLEANEGTSSHYALIRRKKIAGDTTFTISWPTSTKGTIGWTSYSGLHPTAPDEGVAATLHTANNTSYPTPSVTPTTATRWAATFTYSRSTTLANAAIAWTPAAGLTERLDANNVAAATTPWVGVQIADSAGTVTQAAHTYTAVQAFSEAHGAALLLYLIPAPPSVAAFAGWGIPL